MALLPNVYGALKASGAVTAILGANPRVFRHGIAPQGTLAPYCTWMLIAVDPQNSLDGAAASDRQVLQIDLYHTTDGGIEQLADAVRAALEPHAALTGVPIDEREPETGLYRIALQWDWWR